MKVLSIVNQKGGVGKTAVAANVAALVGAAGGRVLAIDADPQAALTRQLLDLGTQRHLVLGLGAALKQEQSIADITVRSTSAQVDLVPSSRSLANEEIGLVSVTRREERLARALVGVDGYDLILIDCPPNLGLLTVNALAASDEVLIPVSAEDEGAVRGVGEVLLTLAEVYGDQEQPPVSAVLTKWDRRREAADAVERGLRGFGGVTLIDTPIPDRALHHKAPMHRTPAAVLTVSKKHDRDVRRAYEKLVRALGYGEKVAT